LIFIQFYFSAAQFYRSFWLKSKHSQIISLRVLKIHPFEFTSFLFIPLVLKHVWHTNCYIHYPNNHPVEIPTELRSLHFLNLLTHFIFILFIIGIHPRAHARGPLPIVDRKEVYSGF